jgi:adenosylhomocysteine nucleosidase
VSRVTIVTALRVESRAVLSALHRPRRVARAERPTWRGAAGAHEITLLQAGVGPRAVREIVRLLPPTDVLVSIGFAGALTPALVAGDIVLPTAIVWEDEAGVERYVVPVAPRAAVATALAAEWGRVMAVGDLFSSPTVLAAASAKRVAAERHGAVAVEMEAAVLAAHARAHGVAFLALRAILDAADLSLEGLPPNLEVSWAARARLLTMPAVWPLVATLRQGVAVATTALTRSARVALPALPDAPSV